MSEIESVAPILAVIEDEGEYIVRAAGPIGKKIAQVVLGAISGARKVTLVSDNDVKVFRAKKGSAPEPKPVEQAPDIQEQFEQTIEPESPAPARKRIIQDGAAPPAPELVEDYEKELVRQRAESAALQDQQRFNAENGVAQEEPEPVVEIPKRKTRERQLAVAGSACGRCAGSGQIMGEAGFQGMCPVCQGKGQIRAWGRGKR